MDRHTEEQISTHRQNLSMSSFVMSKIMTLVLWLFALMSPNSVMEMTVCSEREEEDSTTGDIYRSTSMSELDFMR